MTDRRIFAIAINKGWIELQAAKSPPKANVTEVVRMVKRKEYKWSERYITYEMKEIDVPFKLIQTVYTGGKVVGQVTTRSFKRLTKIGLGAGGCFELSADLIELMKEKGYLDVKKGRNVSQTIKEKVEQAGAEA